MAEMGANLPPAGANDEVLLELLTRYFDAQITQAELAQLNQRLANDIEARRAYVVVAMQSRIMRETMAARFLAETSSESHELSEDMSILIEAIEQDRAASAMRAEKEAKEALLQHSEADARRQRLDQIWGAAEPVKPIKHYVIPKVVFYGVIAAVFAMMAMLFWPSQSPTPPIADAQPTAPQFVQVAVLVEQTDAHWIALGGASPAPGDAILNQPMNLVSGTAKLRFNNEAEVLLEAPCSIEPVSNKEIKITHGKLVGRCETDRSHGFVVQTPGARIVDLGTEFGVDVALHGASSVQVTQGAVRVALADAGRLPGPSVRLTAGQSATVDPAVNSLVVSKHIPFVLPSTGRDIEVGTADSRWRVRRSMQEAGASSSAYAVAPGMRGAGGLWLPIDERSKWLAPASQLFDSQTADGRFIFETTFEIGDDIDPDSIMIQGRLSADDGVLFAELNGQTVKTAPFEFERTTNGVHEVAYQYWREFEIKHGFVKGRNVLRFVVENAPYQGAGNVVGFRAEFTDGSAVRSFQVTN